MSERNGMFLPASKKVKVALESVKGIKTINGIAQEIGVHPTQVNQWKKDLLENAGSLFEGKRGSKQVNVHRDPDWLYAKIGQLSTELDWLKTSGLSQQLNVGSG